MMKPYSNAKLDSRAVRLFQKFARFEYALKAAGFHHGDGNAKPNWQQFALAIEHAFTCPQSEAVREAVDSILNHPPMKQIIRGGVLAWDSATPSTNSKTDRVLTHVRRVRNNLFHGGKFNGRWFEPERSEELLRHSLTILDACLAASEVVREAYDH